MLRVAILIACLNVTVGLYADNTEASQCFKVRVPPSLTVETIRIDRLTSGSIESAIRLAGSGAAGLTADFQVHSISSVGAKNQGHPIPALKLRIENDAQRSWRRTTSAKSRPQETSKNSIRGVSIGPGSATLVLESQCVTNDIEIVLTIISNE